MLDKIAYSKLENNRIKETVKNLVSNYSHFLKKRIRNLMNNMKLNFLVKEFFSQRQFLFKISKEIFFCFSYSTFHKLDVLR